MADTASAGTLIGALLETAGYVTQSVFLEQFENFFKSGGALVFIMAAMGGLLSVALFGSYKMGRYLLVGPAIYWMLIIPRIETEGAIWKLGDGAPRTQNGATTEAEAAKWNKDQLQNTASEDAKQKGTALQVNGKPIKVALVFKWFTTLIDSFVHESVATILKKENDEDLMFIARGHALDNLINAQMDRQELYQMFENNMFGDCNRMMNAAVALSNPETSPEFETFLRNTANNSYESQVSGPVRADAIKQARAYYQSEYDAAKQMRVRPNAATAAFLIRKQTEGSAAEVYNRVKQSSGVSDPNPEQLMQNATLSCEEMWNVTAQAFMDDAKWIYKKVEAEYSDPISNTPEGRRMMCETLRRKLNIESEAGFSTAGQCDLVQTVGVLLIRNAVNDLTYQKAIQEQKNKLQARKAVPRGTVLFTDDPQRQYKPAGTESKYFRMGKDDEGKPRQEAQAGWKWEGSPEGGGGKWVEDGSWHPYTSIARIPGHLDAAFTEHMQYQTRGLRQKIYTFALNLPYMQGMGLYVVAIAYPFLALMVLIPGRAQSFFYVPLFWLWLKSWDIGFAIVMVFEKVLWNMFPSRDIPAKLDEKALPDLLQQAFKSDPMYNVHSYYMLLSIALLAVPALTAAATIKSKRAILSSFPDFAKGAADEANELGEGAYTVVKMNMMNRNMQQYAGVAQLAVGRHGQGLFGGGRGMEAAMALATRAGSGALKNLLGQGQDAYKANLGNMTDIHKSITADTKKVLDYVQARIKRDATLAGQFDDKLGRYGEFAQMVDAVAASLDGGGTFEINDLENFGKAIDAEIELSKATIELALGMLTDVSEGTSKGLNRSVTQRWGDAAGEVSQISRNLLDKTMVIGANILSSSSPEYQRFKSPEAMAVGSAPQRSLPAPGVLPQSSTQRARANNQLKPGERLPTNPYANRENFSDQAEIQRRERGGYLDR